MSRRIDTREELFDVMSQIATEREDAKPAVDHLLSSSEVPWDEAIPDAWVTAGFVQELTVRADTILGKNPAFTLELAQLALTIARKVPRHVRPPIVHAHLEGEAWKEIGRALRYISATDAALRAYTISERVFESASLAHSAASARFCRSIVLADIGCFDDALDAIGQSDLTFRSFGDHRRSVMAEIMRASNDFAHGRLHEARLRYESLIEEIERVNDDPYTVGVIYQNIGVVCEKLGDYAHAKSYSLKAREISTLLDSPAEVDRADMTLARTSLAHGKVQEAALKLRALRSAYFERGMVGAAAVAGLDLVDALIGLDERTEALSVTQQVVEELRNTKLVYDRTRALGYLRELIHDGSEPSASASPALPELKVQELHDIDAPNMETVETAQELRDMTEQIGYEREVARPIVEEILLATSDPLQQPIPSTWSTAGFVQALTERANHLIEEDVNRGFLLAQLAITVANGIRPGLYPAVVLLRLQGTAWKAIGYAHNVMSGYAAASVAYKRAERFFSDHSALAHDVACTKLARAVSASGARNLDEASRLVEEAASTLELFGDRRRLIMSQLIKVRILIFRGDFRRAKEQCDQLLGRLHEVDDDHHTIATIYQNYGAICLALGLLDDTAVAFARAHSIFSDLKLVSELNRVKWGQAKLSLARGEFANALLQLRIVEAAFRDSGLPLGAALLSLDIVEALICLNHRDEALRVAEAALKDLDQGKLSHHAATALGYLRDLLGSTPRPREQIRHVRLYIEELRSDPQRLFLPLPD